MVSKVNRFTTRMVAVTLDNPEKEKLVYGRALCKVDKEDVAQAKIMGLIK